MYTSIVGYARSNMTTDQFKDKLRKALKGDQECIESFLSICHYHSGQYDRNEDFSKLNDFMTNLENGQCNLYQDENNMYSCHKNRVFYFAIPPSIFCPVSQCIHGILSIASLIVDTCINNNGYHRLVVEKPFGKDYDSSKELNSFIQNLFDESAIYV